MNTCLNFPFVLSLLNLPGVLSSSVIEELKLCNTYFCINIKFFILLELAFTSL